MEKYSCKIERNPKTVDAGLTFAACSIPMQMHAGRFSFRVFDYFPFPFKNRLSKKERKKAVY